MSGRAGVRTGPLAPNIESKQSGIGVVLAIIGLDVSGIGLTMPILPRLR